MKSINFWAGSGGAEVRETCSLERECVEVPWATQAPDAVGFQATEHLRPQAFCTAGFGGDASLREAWVSGPRASHAEQPVGGLSRQARAGMVGGAQGLNRLPFHLLSGGHQGKLPWVHADPTAHWLCPSVLRISACAGGPGMPWRPHHEVDPALLGDLTSSNGARIETTGKMME